jgi:hypothetical protein
MSHNPETNELHVRFLCKCAGDGCERCGSTGFSSEYAYDGVPAEKHEAIKSADSVGSMFHALIKKGGHAYRRIS